MGVTKTFLIAIFFLAGCGHDKIPIGGMCSVAGVDDPDCSSGWCCVPKGKQCDGFETACCAGTSCVTNPDGMQQCL
jgi:hypothetical protein